MRVTLKWHQKDQLTLTSGLSSSKLYRINSPYDPDFSGVGTSMAGYTQWSALYLRYRVRGYRCVVRFIPNGLNSISYCGAVAVVPTTVSFSDTQDAMASKWGKGLIFNQYSDVVPLTLEGKISSLFGSRDISVVSDDTYSAGIGQNPTQTGTLQVWGECMTDLGTQYLAFTVDIYQDIEWYKPNLLLSV